VWINARTYNGRTSPVTKAAEHLEAIFDSTLAAAREGSAGDGSGGGLETIVATVATPADASRRAEERERAAAVRSEPVGRDRLGRSYYWDGVSLLVENTTGVFSCGTCACVRARARVRKQEHNCRREGMHKVRTQNKDTECSGCAVQDWSI